MRVGGARGFSALKGRRQRWRLFAQVRVKLSVLNTDGESKVTNGNTKYPLLDQLTPVHGTEGGDRRERLVDILDGEIARGSGLVLLTTDPELAGHVVALARESGRREWLGHLTLWPTPLLDQTTSFNPFASGNADEIRRLLMTQLGEPAEVDACGVFRGRAVALARMIAPALTWLRDSRGIPIESELIRSAMEFRWIAKLANERIAVLRDPATGAMRELDVAKEIPEDIVWPLRCYLDELPGYDRAQSLDEQKDSKPQEQHAYAEFYFTPGLAALAADLHQKRRVNAGDIDMCDIVFDGRILVVSPWPLKKPDVMLERLGKLVVASLRNAVAHLGTRGSVGFASNGSGKASPRCLVVLNDVAGGVVDGLDSTAAIGESLNIGFVLTAPDLDDVWMSAWAQAA